MCRPCTLEIRYSDMDWVFAELERRTPEPRGLQLAFLLDGVKLAAAHPLRKKDGPIQRPSPRHLPSWMKARLPAQPRADDPRICPPQMPGQTTLLRVRRAFVVEDALRILDRPIPELPAISLVVSALAAARGLTQSWQRLVINMVRLALAAREPDEPFVREEDTDQLPMLRPAVVEALRQSGLLRSRPGPQSHRLSPRPRTSGARRPVSLLDSQRSCEHCLSWSGTAARLCDGCWHWAREHEVGGCHRCRRNLPVKDGRCRFCQIVLRTGRRTGQVVDQLWFGGDLAVPFRGAFPGGQRRHGRQGQPGTVGDDAELLSPHLVDPAQLVVFNDLRRDWTRIDLARLPAPARSAQRLLDEFADLARAEAWTVDATACNMRVLRVVLTWLGADAPIPEADVVAAGVLGAKYTSQRVVEFLRAGGLLTPDPANDIGASHAVVQRLVASLPEQLVPEVEAWIQVLRGAGGRPSIAIRWEAISSYVRSVVPTLQQWGEHTDSLRSITSDDVVAALKTHRGNQVRSLHTGLRSLFRALKRERIIFQDPTRGVRVAIARRLPTPLPTDRLRGLLDRAPGAQAKLVVALIAVHALYIQDLRHLLLADLDRVNARLTVRRQHATHTVFLDELTLRLISAWVRERARR